MSFANGASIIALAGRRIDADLALTPRFPFDQTNRVRSEIADHLRGSRALVLVCSAACGADLVALDAASDMGLRTRIILPFSADRFRQTSVVDRPHPEYWGAIFDRITQISRARGDLVELGYDENDDAAYAAANTAIIDEAREICQTYDPVPSLVALVVWEGGPRGSDDNTRQFAELARSAGFRLESILTVNAGMNHLPERN
jgi:hypothetical protein